jgi:hypothetical protein
MKINSEEKYQEIYARYSHLVDRTAELDGGVLVDEREELRVAIEEYKKQIYPLGVEVTPLSCPFCDNSKYNLSLSLDRKRGHYVMCGNCYAHGPYSKGEENAVAMWNHRE